MSRRSFAIAFGILLAWMTTQSAYGASPGLPIRTSPSAVQPKLPTGELPDRRTRNSKTSRNSNGSYTTTIATGPLNYRDSKGKWEPIDSTLVSTGKADYAWRNRANAFTASFKSNLSGDYLRLEASGKTFRFSLAGASAAQGSAKSSQVLYRQAFPSVDLRYDVGAGGVKETLQLANASVPNHYQFILTPPDKTLVQAVHAADGSWQFFLPPEDSPAFTLAIPHAADSSMPGTGLSDPENNAALIVTKRSGNFLIDLAIDPTWLHSSERVFPVQLDPTISIQPDSQDAYFHGNVPTDTGFDSAGYLHVGDSDAHYDWGAVQFNLGTIPVNARISQATLGLYYEGHCIATTILCGGTTHTLEAHRMTAVWSPSSQTQQLAYDSTVLSSLTMTLDSNFHWLSWDVTPTAQNWYSGAQPNDGLLLKRNPDVLGASGPALPSNQFTVDSNLGPKLDVTYATDPVVLTQPTTLHSNGADLSWQAFSGVSGPFQKYEVHRSSVANFTPSSSTLLTTITDPTVTSFRDTTAAPNGTFYYNVVANSSPSNYIAVTLPADGQATKLLQPGPEGKDTYNYYLAGSTVCSTYGTSDHMTIGTDTNRISRGFLSYGLNDIPTGATISSATLSLWHYQTVPLADKLHAYRVTHDWAEGSSNSAIGACTGDGVTWYETNGGVAWTNQGGDFASGSSDQSNAVSVAANEAPTWNTFNITSIVQQWVNGTAPNYGLTVKLDNEALVAGNLIRYYAGDFTGDPSLRPKLSLSYTDGSHAIAPAVSIAAPAAGATVRGSTVSLTAAASDDRRVDKVEFYVDGGLVGSSTAGPFTYIWNSSSVSNGSHNLTAKAYDDAGNTTTSSPATPITVANYANPTTNITAPKANSSVSGTVSVSATATVAAGLTVSKLEFYFDNTLFATVTAPASGSTSTVSWNTLDSSQPAFDGTRSLTTKVYDSSGLIVTSSTVNVSVINTYRTEYQGTMTPSTSVPLAVVYDPSLGSNQTPYPVKVNLTNTSSTTWSSTNTFLRYRWFSPDSQPVVTDGPNVSLPFNVTKNGGTASNIVVTVIPPTLPDGVDSALYTLRFDLYDSSTGSLFAAKGNQPSDNPVIVSRALQTALGLEKYYQYVGQDVGGGMQSLLNVANGNSILHYEPFSSPGRGLATVVGLTYNSLENHSDSPAGNNWSLSISSLSRFGDPIDIHPNDADSIAGRSNRWIQFVDGDGTPHRFAGFQDANGVVYWIEPPGVHLYLRQYSTTDTTRWWAFTRPDRVTFFYNQSGYPTYVTDRYGNTLSFTLTSVQPGDDPGGPKFHITSVTDAAGQGTTPAPRRSYTITYFVKADGVKPQVRGKVKSITDHGGHELDFSYYDDGNLLRLTERGGTNADGTTLADRSWVFTYTTPSGGTSNCTTAVCDAPAILTMSARINPDPKTSSQSTRIYSVRDPNGVVDTSRNETRFDYYGPTSSTLDRWKLGALIDRAGNSTSFSWDNTNRIATVAPPAPGQSRTSTYAYDSDGKITMITNPLQQTTLLQWSSDFAVTQIQETGGTSYITKYSDNENGYLTDKTDALTNTTHLGYTNFGIDSNDVSSHWCTSAIAASTPCSPRAIGHASLLTSKTDPLGMPSAATYTWQFIYDSTNTSIKQVKDPLGDTTTYTNNSDGTIASVTDARGDPPTQYSYDANGHVTQVIDGLGNKTTRSFDDDGHIQWIQDPNHENSGGPTDSQYRTKFYYDSFHRLGRVTQPKFPSFSPPGSTLTTGTLITIDTGYDANNNTTSQTTPYYTSADRYVSATSYDVMDRRSMLTSPDKVADTAGERTRYQYDIAGRLTQVTLPIGMQNPDANNTHNIFYAYDPLDRPIGQTRYHVQSGTVQNLVTVGCYNAAGDLTSVTQPLAGLTPATINCTSSSLNYTSYYQYDLDHRLTLTTDAEGRSRSLSYDKDGNVSTSNDANTNPTKYSYDQLNRLTEIDEPFVATTPGNPTRYVSTVIVYDAVGNRSQLISPRAFDAAGGKAPFTNFVTAYQYDQNNRLIRTDLPVDATSANPNFNTHYYVHQQYDANGNIISTSLPDTNTDPSLVPANKKTTVQYYDTGDVYSSQDGSGPKSYFDYTAAGQQDLKVPSDAAGNLDMAHRMEWLYLPDGQLQQRQDRGNQLIQYSYDADNVLIMAKNASGGGEIDTTVTPDDMDRQATVQNQTSTTTTQSTYTYDLNGNITDSLQDKVTAPVAKAGSNLHYDYDRSNWLKDQCTLTTPPTPITCANPTGATDQRVLTQFTPTGWTSSRELDQGGSSAWTAKQTTTWQYYANGKLNVLDTYSGTITATKVEEHTVNYTLDPLNVASMYLDGNRTQDSFFVTGNGNTQCRTSSTRCNDTYGYDPRDRLVQESKGDATNTSYFNPVGSGNLGLDPTGNIVQEQIVSGGATTTKNYIYGGNQLQKVTTNGVDSLYWYNDDGDLWCVTNSAGSKANCPISAQTTPPSTVQQAYAYDYLFRLQNYRAFSGGQLTDCADYQYDSFDRLIWEGETHGSGGICNDSKTTQFTFAGLTNQMTEEQQSSAGTLQTTKDYAYDIYGQRMTESVTPAGQASTTYTYAYNVHDSVSLLLDPTGTAKTSYGYRPYGDLDSALTGGEPDKNNPFNPYRYAAKRFDSGSQTVDMGARRFATDTSKFLQPDQFDGALANLSLGTDPLSQNRYSLAGGNPLSFIEWDGHRVLFDGGGTGNDTPNPSGSSGGLVRNYPTLSGADLVRTCLDKLNCGAGDIEQMTAPERQAFLLTFQYRYGRDGANFAGWFNNVQGVVRFLGRERLITPGSWFSIGDAVTIEGIEMGYYEYRNNLKGVSRNPGADLWRDFFQARAEDPGNTSGALRLWGLAEITTVHYGANLADESTRRPKGTDTFVAVGDDFRRALISGDTSSYRHDLAKQFGNGACGPIGPACEFFFNQINSNGIYAHFFGNVYSDDFLLDVKNEQFTYEGSLGLWNAIQRLHEN